MNTTIFARLYEDIDLMSYVNDHYGIDSDLLYPDASDEADRSNVTVLVIDAEDPADRMIPNEMHESSIEINDGVYIYCGILNPQEVFDLLQTLHYNPKFFQL